MLLYPLAEQRPRAPSAKQAHVLTTLCLQFPQAENAGEQPDADIDDAAAPPAPDHRELDPEGQAGEEPPKEEDEPADAVASNGGDEAKREEAAQAGPKGLPSAAPLPAVSATAGLLGMVLFLFVCTTSASLTFATSSALPCRQKARARPKVRSSPRQQPARRPSKLGMQQRAQMTPETRPTRHRR